MPHGHPPTPEDVGRRFRIAQRRPEGAPVGKADEFEDVMQRQLDRGPLRQAKAPSAPSPLGDDARD